MTYLLGKLTNAFSLSILLFFSPLIYAENLGGLGEIGENSPTDGESLESQMEALDQMKMQEAESTFHPLELAVFKQDLPKIKELLASGGLKSLDKKLLPLFYHLILAQDLEIMELFLKAGVDANMVDEQGVTPLALSVVYNQPAQVQLLIKYKADVNKMFQDRYLMDYALFRGFSSVGGILEKAGSKTIYYPPIPDSTVSKLP